MSSSGSYLLVDMPEEQLRKHRSGGRRAELLRITRDDGKADHVTTHDIAERLEVTLDEARYRLLREQRLDGPVTWAGLSKKTRTKR